MALAAGKAHQRTAIKRDQDPTGRKRRLQQTITVYGRHPVLDALADDGLVIDRLHLASSNKPGGSQQRIEELCQRRGIPIQHHTRRELSRISRNGRQDQGVAADVFCPTLSRFDDWLAQQGASLAERRLLVLDGITNPQNLGMSIRSGFAAGVDAILLPTQGASGLNPLAIKASAGTAFRAPLVACKDLHESIQQLAACGLQTFALTADAQHDLFELPSPCYGAFVLGNETRGVSPELLAICQQRLSIPMQTGVESLNVAVCAALVAFHIRA